MLYSPEFVEKVAEANNLVDIISQYTQLKSSGGGYMGRCPFPDHPEKTASFSVSETKQVYHCFGCKKSGNIFSFLQTYNGMSFREAIEFLADRANIRLPEPEQGQKSDFDQAAQKKKKLTEINRAATLYFQNTFKKLPESHPAKSYALSRGLTAEIQEEFRIGYSTDEWDGLVKHLEAKGFSLELAEEAKLIKARTGGKSGYFDLFRERLMFPILSTTGEPVGFGGRIIQKGEPKYLNSPDSMTFHKGKMLYGLYHTAKYIRAEDQVMIVEGYMDLISLFKNSVRHVVAPMGTALTADQAKILRRSTKNVIVLFDGDEAGQSAAERSLPILLAGDLHPKGLILPEGLDPDDYLKKYGSDQLKDLLSKASDLFGVVLGQWMAGYRGEASQKVQLADRLRPIFEAIADPRLRQLYLNEAAQKMNVDPKWLIQAVAPTARKNTAMPFSPQNKGPEAAKPSSLDANLHAEVMPTTSENPPVRLISLKNISKVEQTLLSLCLKNRANLEVVLSEGLLPQIQSAGVKEVLERAASVYRQAPEKFDRLTSLLAGMVDRPEALFVDASMMTQKTAEGFAAEEGEDGQLLKDCVIKIKDHHLQNQIKALMIELKGSGDPEKLKRLADLQKERLSLRN